jgi:hypothetical protein
VGLVPKLLLDKDTLKRIREWAKDPGTAIQLFEVLASIEGDVGPDIIYMLSRRWDIRDKDTKQLAEDILYSKDVRPKASPALSVVLDLRAAEECKDVPKLLAKVKLQGDKRADKALGRFHSKLGCGDNKRLDCWPCLRGDDLLKDAGAAARKRKPPL